MAVCSKCGAEYKEGELHVHKGEVLEHEGKTYCENCLVDLGIPIDETQTYETYLKLLTDIKKPGI